MDDRYKTLRELLADERWHTTTEITRRVGSGVPSVLWKRLAAGLDGGGPLVIEHARVSEDGSIRARRGGIALKCGKNQLLVRGRSLLTVIFARALKAFKPPPLRLKRCFACEESLPRWRFHLHPGGQLAQACAACAPVYRQDRSRKAAELEGRAYLPWAERAARGRAWSDTIAKLDVNPATVRKWVKLGLIAGRFDFPAIEARAARLSERRRLARDPEHQRARIVAAKTKRKRAIAGAYVEPVNRERIAMRDGWRCAICFGRVTRKTWSLDHVVPVSDGGEHSYRNVVLTHLLCNISRGPGRRPSQAPLFARMGVP